MRVNVWLAGACVAAGLVAAGAEAATVVSFVAVSAGETLTVSNPQASAVSGQIRLVPDAGSVAGTPLAVSVAAQGSQAFPNILSSFGAVRSPAILAVETTDGVRVSSAPLRVGHAERPLTLPVRFDPGAPASGVLVLGILDGVVRVSIYEHATSGTPVATRTFSSEGEQVARVSEADVLPAGLRIGDGYARVTPLSGQVVGTSVNAPVRRRAVGTAPSALPALSVTGGPACEFATGVRASVPATAGASYKWTLVNATAQGAMTGSALDLALGSRGYASIVLETTVNGTTTSAEATVRIEGKPEYRASSATSVTLGEDASISWTLTGSAPTSQTLSGTDLGTVNLGASATSYTYHPTTAGTKSYALSAANACGTGSANGTYAVAPDCIAPHIDSFTNNGPACAGGSAQLTWATSGSGTVTIDHGVGTVSSSGSVAVSPSDATQYTITKTASCGTDSGTTTVTLRARPTASVSGGGAICPGGSVQISAALTGTAPWSVQWSDGVTQSGVVSSPASRSVSPSSTATYTVTSVTDASCTGTSSGSALVTVTPTPAAPTFGASGPVCADSVGNTITVTNLGVGNSLAGASCTSGCTVTNVTSATITYTAGSTGPIVLSAQQQTAGGCTSPMGSSGNVTLNPLPATPAITTPASTCASSTGNTATIASPGVGSTIAWAVTNGSITGGQGTTSLTYTAGASGTTTVGVTVTNASGCSATDSASVTINVTSATLTANPTTINFGQASTLNFTITNGASWSFNDLLGNSIGPGTGTGSGSFTSTYNADNSSGSDTVTLTVIDACGGSHTFSVPITVN